MAAHEQAITNVRAARSTGHVRRREVHVTDRWFYAGLWFSGACVIALLVGVVIRLTSLARPELAVSGLSFLWSAEWNPVSGSQEGYGALPFIYGTLVSSFLALLMSVPVSVAVALFLTEIGPWMESKTRGSIALFVRSMVSSLAYLVEMLAAIPSVVYGLWGIFVLAPWLRMTLQPLLKTWLGPLPWIGQLFSGAPFGVGMLAAGCILAIMITPTIATLCREVFRAIPHTQKEGALALGATRWEMIQTSVLGGAKSGMLSAVILGLGRALGETMAVTMVIGNRNEISASLFAASQTMASLIANEYAEATSDRHLSALAAVGLTLCAVSIVVNGAARLIRRRAEKSLGGVR